MKYDKSNIKDAPKGYYWFKDHAKSNPWHVVNILRYDEGDFTMLSIYVTDMDQRYVVVDESFDEPIELNGPIPTPDEFQLDDKDLLAVYLCGVYDERNSRIKAHE